MINPIYQLRLAPGIMNNVGTTHCRLDEQNETSDIYERAQKQSGDQGFQAILDQTIKWRSRLKSNELKNHNKSPESVFLGLSKGTGHWRR